MNKEILHLLERIDSLTARLIHAPAEQLPELLRAREDAILLLDCTTSEELPQEVLSALFVGIQRVILSSSKVERRLLALRSDAMADLTRDAHLHSALTRYAASHRP